jgi:Transposase DDE domain group 1
VKRTKLPRHPLISADGEGVANHAGGLLLQEVADRLGLTRALSRACAAAFQDVRVHDPGTVLRDLAVMIADGGDCLADLCTLRDQPDLFGTVASDATAWRVIDRIEQVGLSALDVARAEARRSAWAAGLQPERITLDLDSTLVTSHSEKEGAAATYKRGFGFHPLLCTLDETKEVLAGILRPGNATANNAADNIAVLDAGLAQLPTREATEPILVRSDSAGATHELVDAVRDRELRFSIGFDLTAPVREAILALPGNAWMPALRQDGEQREGADVAELSGLDLRAWPVDTRAICRREIPHPGAQLTFSDLNGYRFQVFITDQLDADIAYLEARHRGHARVEDRIRCAKDTGLRNLPFHDFAANAVWLQLVLMATDLLAWMQGITLEGEARTWEPKRLRYALLHTAARLTRSGRRLHVRLQRTWRWSPLLSTAFQRLRQLPQPT